MLLVAVLLAAGPAILGYGISPFSNYNSFGFRFGNYASGVYRIGYWDEDQSRWLPLGHNHGGFFDYRLTTQVDSDIRGWRDALDAGTGRWYGARLWQYVRATRPEHSERWLLGRAALPLHLLSGSGFARRLLEAVPHLVHGRLVDRSDPASLEWEDLGPLPPVP